MNKPFTLGEAVFICNYYQSLVNQRYDEGTALCAEIECVAVTPYEKGDKIGFITLYAVCSCPHRALHAYKGLEYDVLVISRLVSKPEIILHMPISEFLTKHNQVLETHIASYTFPLTMQL